MDARPSWSSSQRLRFASRRLRHHHRPGPRIDPAGIVGGVAQMGLERESGPWLASSRWPPTPTSILTGCSVLRLEGVPNLSTSPENEALATVKSRPPGQTGMGGLSGGLGVGTPPGHRGRWRRSRRRRRDPRTRRPPDSSRPRHPCFQRPQHRSRTLSSGSGNRARVSKHCPCLIREPVEIVPVAPCQGVGHTSPERFNHGGAGFVAPDDACAVTLQDEVAIHYSSPKQGTHKVVGGCHRRCDTALFFGPGGRGFYR